MSEAGAPRVYCDFNEGDDAGGYWILYYNDRPLADQIEELRLKEGSEVVLYQDEGDFEVPGIVGRGRAFFGEGEESWVVFPDWSRRVDHS